jgi:[ribosomal protein S18]-alanine N-acetyltransferase
VTLAIRRAHAADLASVYLGELDYIRMIEPGQEARWKDAVASHLEQWAAALDQMFVAEIAGRIVGYCFWKDHGDEAVLASLYVVPDYRRQGLGRKLLMRFIADAKSHRVHNATLGVQSGNPARLLYEKVGFVRTHDTDGFLHYRLTLTPD